MKTEMPYQRVGRSGLQISRLSLGSWVTFHSQVGAEQATQLMSLAFEHGVNFFDNAEVYAGGQSEIIMGQALKKLQWPRLKYIVSTKFFWGLNQGPNQRHTLNRKYLMQSMEASLKRWDLDHIDLIYCHRPDPHTPLEETVRAMNDIIEKGQALYWGTSEWSADEIRAADSIARENSWHRPIVEQPQYNLFEKFKVETDYKRLYDDIGLGLTTWSPLASGILTGKYLDKIPAGSRLEMPSMDWLREEALSNERTKKVKSFVQIAQKLGCKPSQLSIAWCLKNHHVSSVILGATKKEQLLENLESLNYVEKLTPQVMEDLITVFGSTP